MTTYRDALLRQRRARFEAEYRAGLHPVYPGRITVALDLHGLHGPTVDRACLAEEPAVDRWEAGEGRPSWEQLCALADLVGLTPEMFCRPQPASGPLWLSGEDGCHLLPGHVYPPPWSPNVVPLAARPDPRGER